MLTFYRYKLTFSSIDQREFGFDPAEFAFSNANGVYTGVRERLLRGYPDSLFSGLALVVQCGDVERQRLAGTVFRHFRLLNALEFKGVHDPLTLTDYNRILLRAWGQGALSGRSRRQQSAFLQQITQDERYQLPG